MSATIEKEILHRTVKALRAAYPDTLIELCYEDDAEPAMYIYTDSKPEDYEAEAFACDSCTLRVLVPNATGTIPSGETVTHYRHAWVYFVWQGLESINDYTESLAEAMSPVEDWIDDQWDSRP